MQRVVIIGPPGSGKTMVANKLGTLLNLPVFQIDAIRFDSNGEFISQEEFDRKTGELIAPESWIIEGNHRSTLPQRCRRADSVVILDLPRRLCWWRAVKANLFPRQRWMRNPIRGIRVLWIWAPIKMPELRRVVYDNTSMDQIVHLKSSDEVAAFVDSAINL